MVSTGIRHWAGKSCCPIRSGPGAVLRNAVDTQVGIWHHHLPTPFGFHRTRKSTMKSILNNSLYSNARLRMVSSIEMRNHGEGQFINFPPLGLLSERALS